MAELRMPVVPGYEAQHVLGRGGFGTVFAATQLSVGRTVALKVIPASGFDADTMRRFRAETATVGSLSWHPHVVPLYDAGVTPEGVAFLAMEMLPDGSLGDRIEGGRPLGPELVVRYGGQVADALAAAHQADILHRDIKPDNVLLSTRGDAKLADFGVATLTDGTRTATGLFTGTIAYSAPELLDGGRADVRSEVYALGATLHALAAGRAPFGSTGETPLRLLWQVANGERTPLPADVPVRLAELIDAMMDRAPVARPSEDEVRAALAGLGPAHAPATPEPPPATPPPVVEPVDPAVTVAAASHRPPAPAPVTALAPVTVTAPDPVTVAGTGAGGPDGPDDPVGSPASRPGRPVAVLVAAVLVAILVVGGAVLLGGGDDDDRTVGSTTSTTSPSGAADEDTATSSSTTDSSTSTTTAEVVDAPIGEACGDLPADGEGSVLGLADDTAGVAASNVPMLSSFTSAVIAADLTDALNDPDAEYTILAPSDIAFARVPGPELDALLADLDALTTTLTHHVFAEGRMDLGQLQAAGQVTALDGGTVTFTGPADRLEVDRWAMVVCGNITTANATIHIIDAVLGRGTASDGVSDGPEEAGEGSDSSGATTTVAEDLPSTTAAP